MRYHIYRLGIAILFYAILYRRQTTAAEISENHKPEVDEYVYYQGVQGKPGVDFPIYARIPRTGFSCRQIPSGYYADLDTDCQVFHICNEGKKISFLCPNGTIFQQSDLICEWWFKVNCTNSPNLYEESAEQLQEDTWRRKTNRKPGYQNRIAVDQKKFKDVEGAGRRTENRGREQPKKFNASSGRRGYKNKVNLENEASVKGNQEYQTRTESPSNYNTKQHGGNYQDYDAGNQFDNPSGQDFGRSQISSDFNADISKDNQEYQTRTNYNNNQNGGSYAQEGTGNQYQKPQDFGRSQSSSDFNADQRKKFNTHENSGRSALKANGKIENDEISKDNQEYQTRSKYDNNQSRGNHAQEGAGDQYQKPQNFGRSSPEYNPDQTGGNYNQGIQGNQYPANPATQDPTSHQNVRHNQENQNVKQNQENQNVRDNQKNKNQSPGTGRTATQEYAGDDQSISKSPEDRSSNRQRTRPNLDTNRKENGRRIADTHKNVVSHQVQKETRNKQVHGSRGSMKYKTQLTLKGRNELTYDDSSEETQIPEESASFYKNNQNAIQNTGKPTPNPYPNHKETYTEVHEPKFISTKAYTTGPQTTSPQTFSTNKIPLNDGKPFVVTTPKSSYNIKDDTTETFKYSPTVPAYTTKKLGVTTILPGVEETYTTAQEEVTFSAPYSNVVTEQSGKITTPVSSIGYTNQVNSFSGLDDIVHTTGNQESAYSGVDSSVHGTPNQEHSFSGHDGNIQTARNKENAFSGVDGSVHTTSNQENFFSGRDGIIQTTSNKENAFSSVDGSIHATGNQENSFSSFDGIVQTTENTENAFSGVEDIAQTTPNLDNSFSGLDGIVQTTSKGNTDYVRISGQTKHAPAPEKIQITVSSAQPTKNVKLNDLTTTNLQDITARNVQDITSRNVQDITSGNSLDIRSRNSQDITSRNSQDIASRNSQDITSRNSNDISTTTTTQRTLSTPVHRRYSAALSQANPNNACIDEVTTSVPSSQSPDFQVVIGRQRETPTTESQLFKITAISGNSITPEINKPRSFEKATESPIYRVDLSNKVVEKVTEAYTLKPTGFYITKVDDTDVTTKFGNANTYLPRVTTPSATNTHHQHKNEQPEFDVVLKPKPFELPSTEEYLESTSPNYEVSSARPFSIDITTEPTITPTEPTPFNRNPKVFEHVSSMLNTIRDIIKEKNETESRPGLVVPPSAGPQTLHSLAVYFANALDGVPPEEKEEEVKGHGEKAIELLTVPTLNQYKDLFKEEKEEVTTAVDETEEDNNDLEGQHTKNGVSTPRVRQLAQVFTKALSSYLDDPDMFRKYLQDVRPTEPSNNIATTPATTDNNTEEDELLNYSDADIKPELPRLSTTPSVSPTWGYLLANNNSNSFEYNSLSTDGENLQSADSQSFVSQFNNYIKEKHFGKSTTPLSTDLPDDHWTSSQNATELWKDKLYTNPQAINEDLHTTSSEGKTPSSEGRTSSSEGKSPSPEALPSTELPPSTEIRYELRSLPKIELNSTQVHGILIDFMNTTSNDENNRLRRILSKLNTTQDEFLSKMREIEQNPLTRRLILLLISECATNITQGNHHGAESNLQVSTLPSLFESSRIAESKKHDSINSPIPKYVDHNLKDDDEDTRALQLLNSLYSIASRYGK